MEEQRNINNTHDFSNVLVDEKVITNIVMICDDFYNRLIKTEDAEEEKNKMLKYEYKNYNYKKNYGMGFYIRIVEKSNEYTSVELNNLESFNDFLNSGRLKNVSSVKIYMNLTFNRGTGTDYKTHENLFEITFKPYDITLLRKSNYVDEGMDYIEKTIIDSFEKCTKVNTIFCIK